MKKHAIIPIFIPHQGCPNDCIFCNQRVITARTAPPDKNSVRATIEQYLSTLHGRNLDTIEIAFFGGSFTGIPIDEQSDYLQIAYEFKSEGLVDKIHLSTRPDYISEEILDNLKKYQTDTIELGVQSFDPEVLLASKRGHTVHHVHDACRLIRDHDFELGIQLMIGLPGDTPAKAVRSATLATKEKPQIARLYPTVVLRDTELYEMFKRGEYTPLATEEAVEITKEMYRVLFEAGINIIRVGLKSTDLVSNSTDAGGEYHPAFRQLVEGALAREELEKLLIARIGEKSQNVFMASADRKLKSVTFCSNDRSFSCMIGHKGVNKIYFSEKYPRICFHYAKDNSLEDYRYNVVE